LREAAIVLNVAPKEPTSSSTRVSIRSSKLPAASLSAATPSRLIRRDIREAARYPATPASASARAPASRAMRCMLSSAFCTFSMSLSVKNSLKTTAVPSTPSSASAFIGTA
jgi:hypothetical protein